MTPGCTKGPSKSPGDTETDALILLGVGNVGVYNGSMTEWAADTTLPLVTEDT